MSRRSVTTIISIQPFITLTTRSFKMTKLQQLWLIPILILLIVIKTQRSIAALQDGFVMSEELNMIGVSDGNLHMNCKERYLQVSNAVECSALCLHPNSPLSQEILEPQNMNLSQCKMYLFKENGTFARGTNCLLCTVDVERNLTGQESTEEFSQLYKLVNNVTGETIVFTVLITYFS